MKKILVSMFAVAALAACSTEHTVVAPQNEAIGFDTFVDNATRANDVDINSIKNFGFGVYASVTNGAGQSGLILENEVVTYNGNWGYANTQYWVVGNDYNFTAFAPKADAKWAYQPTGTTAHNGVISFNNRDAAANQDLVFAYAERSVDEPLTAAPDKVGFTFNHMLSRVRFTFANGFQSAGNIELAVSNVHIIDAYANGTLAVENGRPADAWTNLADKNLDVDFGVVAYDNSAVKYEATAAARIAEDAKLSSEHFYLIPNSEATTYAVTFDVTLFQAGVEIDTYSHTVEFTCAMNRGMSYDIKTTLNHQNTSDDDSEIYPIEFTVDAVNNWGEYNEAVTKGLTEVANEADLKAAIAAGKNVKLTADIALTESVLVKDVTSVIDLNGFDLVAESTDAIVVEGGNLTINGNGDVKAATDNESSANALWVKYGNAVINGGNYYVGADNALRNDCIYLGAASLKADAANYVSTITINGGTFEAKAQEYDQYWVLNVQDDFYRAGSKIVVYGGSYKNFNPANNKSEGANTNFVAPGKTVEQNGDWYIVK